MAFQKITERNVSLISQELKLWLFNDRNFKLSRKYRNTSFFFFFFFFFFFTRHVKD
jgi:hypothetical protein